MCAVLSLPAACHRNNAALPSGAPQTAVPQAAAELPPSLLGLTTTPTSATMAVGTQRLLRAEVMPARADVRHSMRFTTSAPNVVVVDSRGEMTALAAGSALVTVTAHSDGGAGLKAVTLTNSATVTVSKP